MNNSSIINPPPQANRPVIEPEYQAEIKCRRVDDSTIKVYHVNSRDEEISMGTIQTYTEKGMMNGIATMLEDIRRIGFQEGRNHIVGALGIRNR